MKTGKMSLKRRIQEYNSINLSTNNAKRAANIIGDIQSDEVYIHFDAFLFLAIPLCSAFNFFEKHFPVIILCISLSAFPVSPLNSDPPFSSIAMVIWMLGSFRNLNFQF